MKNIFTIVMAIALTFGLGVANAFTAVDYVTGSVTRSDIDLDTGFGTIGLDKTTGYSVGAGKHIFGKKWLAVELDYSQTGEASIGGVDIGEVKTIGLHVVATPTLFKINHKPIKAILGVGGVYNKVNSHVTQNFYDTGVQYRVGVSMGITKKLDVFVDYKTMDVDLVSNINLEIDTVGIGAKYYF